jgi:hypothetical protein
MKAIDLIRLNLEIENQVNTDGDLIPLSEKDSTVFTISRVGTDYVSFFRFDVPLEIRESINPMDSEQALNDHEAVKRILTKFVPYVNAVTGEGLYFTHSPTADEFSDVVVRKGCYVVLADGEPASWAWTQDGNLRASELAVETLPAFRRRGYGQQVVSAWASSELSAGRVPFYSYLAGNLPSEALANSLSVVHYATSTSYSAVSQH